eukprot:455300_1
MAMCLYKIKHIVFLCIIYMISRITCKHYDSRLLRQHINYINNNNRNIQKNDIFGAQYDDDNELGYDDYDDYDYDLGYDDEYDNEYDNVLEHLYADIYDNNLYEDNDDYDYDYDDRYNELEYTINALQDYYDFNQY